MLDVIKTENIGEHCLSIVYFESCKGYEVQYSEIDGDCILDSLGLFSLKRNALVEYNGWLKELKKIRVVCAKTGLTFAFNTHKQKEAFFDLWEKYEVIEDGK